MGEVRENLFREGVGWEKKQFFVGSKASPARPCDKGSMQAKTLELLEVVEFCFSQLITNYIV
jgi:hypothetical protein